MFNIKMDFHYLKSSIIIGTMLLSLFLYFTANINLSEMTESIRDNEQTITSLKNNYKNTINKYKKLSKKLNSIDREFIKGKKNFGIYKTMEYLNKYKDIYGFKYNLQQKEKKLTKKYFSHDVVFTIPYQNAKLTKDIIKIIESKYYNSFINGTYSKDSLKLKYKYYGKK